MPHSAWAGPSHTASGPPAVSSFRLDGEVGCSLGTEALLSLVGRSGFCHLLTKPVSWAEVWPGEVEVC